eukprot:CAMPEP_0178719170 /NCGR_PEP_ID=MMETSP0699-20121125/22983_1 /TAXON_ID=265572 /ORGANISM="Extubocellulus spinifer, Strain CCMP396" /LENGTH=237 /DNA_ID=CAMNT_0020369391 /DNA_START=2097 /DNA_END=2810 /DNA_ORIENTATION=+
MMNGYDNHREPSDPTGMELNIPGVHGSGAGDAAAAAAAAANGNVANGFYNEQHQPHGGDGTAAAFDPNAYQYGDDGAMITDTEADDYSKTSAFTAMSTAAGGAGQQQQKKNFGTTATSGGANDGTGGNNSNATSNAGTDPQESETYALEQQIKRDAMEAYKRAAAALEARLHEVQEATKQALSDMKDLLDASAEVQISHVRNQHNVDVEERRVAAMVPDVENATSRFMGTMGQAFGM